MTNGYNRYTTEQAVQTASLIDMTKDVFAPGPDGRVAIRMIHEGEYLGGPVSDMNELNAINAPIVGEFHFVLDQGTWGAWDGSEWKLIGGLGPEQIDAGDAIELIEDAVSVPNSTGKLVLINVKYDPAHAIDLFSGNLGVKIDGVTIIKNALGELEFDGEYERLFHPVEVSYDIYGRPTQYVYDIEGDDITLDISYDMDGLRATIIDSTADIYDAPTKIYTYNNLIRTGTIT